MIKVDNDPELLESLKRAREKIHRFLFIKHYISNCNILFDI